MSSLLLDVELILYKSDSLVYYSGLGETQKFLPTDYIRNMKSSQGHYMHSVREGFCRLSSLQFTQCYLLLAWLA